MSDINIPEGRNLHPFLFMGCWNQRGIARDTVASAIQNSDIETLILGGDNIYPEKRIRVNGSKNVAYDQSVLDEGVELLNKKTIYVTLGNHNVANPEIEAYEFEMPWILPGSYYSMEFADKYAIIVLNTNAVDDDFSTMMTWFSDTQQELRVKRIPYYLIQHEPFVSFKKKKIQMLLHGPDILANITYPPIAILCADTHNYQKGTITYNGLSIPQIIVGTGGAHPDPVTVPIGTIHIENGIRYQMEEHIPGYGYVEVNVGTTEFIKIMDWVTEGGRRKTRYYRRNRKLRRTRKI
jgi:hypothetical protein